MLFHWKYPGYYLIDKYYPGNYLLQGTCIFKKSILFSGNYSMIKFYPGKLLITKN